MFKIFIALVMHMHIHVELMNSFGNWFIGSTLCGQKNCHAAWYNRYLSQPELFSWTV